MEIEDRVINFYLNELFHEELNYTVNERELICIIRFHERFRCHLERWDFEIFTDDKVLKYFFSKQQFEQKRLSKCLQPTFLGGNMVRET